MNNRLDERLNALREEGATIHFGLDLAQYRAVVSSTRTNIELLLEWADGQIDGFDVRLDTPNYQVLLAAADAFEVVDHGERQQYFRHIFSKCLDNGRDEATSENDEPVFPIKHTGWRH